MQYFFFILIFLKNMFFCVSFLISIRFWAFDAMLFLIPILVEANNIEYGNFEDRNIKFDAK